MSGGYDRYDETVGLGIVHSPMFLSLQGPGLPLHKFCDTWSSSGSCSSPICD